MLSNYSSRPWSLTPEPLIAYLLSMQPCLPVTQGLEALRLLSGPTPSVPLHKVLDG